MGCPHDYRSGTKMSMRASILKGKTSMVCISIKSVGNWDDLRNGSDMKGLPVRARPFFDGAISSLLAPFVPIFYTPKLFNRYPLLLLPILFNPIEREGAAMGGGGVGGKKAEKAGGRRRQL